MTVSEDDHDDHSNAQIMCAHVFRYERPLAEIWNYQGKCDEEWSFTCSQDDHDDDDALVTICLGCAFAHHVTMLTKADVPPNHVALRSSDDQAWVVRPMTAEELEGDDN